MNKITTKSKQSKKFLSIEINKPVLEVLDEYCKESGISPQEIGFRIGLIAGQGKERNETIDTLSGLNNMFFFAGMMHANQGGGKFSYKTANELKEELKSMLPKETKHSYVG